MGEHHTPATFAATGSRNGRRESAVPLDLALSHATWMVGDGMLLEGGWFSEDYLVLTWASRPSFYDGFSWELRSNPPWIRFSCIQVSYTPSQLVSTTMSWLVNTSYGQQVSAKFLGFKEGKRTRDDAA